MGESTSDYFVHLLNPVLAVALGALCLLGALILQFSVRRYVPWIYWLAVAMVAVFGTMAADVLHIGFGIPYVVSTTLFFFILIVIFIAWYATEKTLSIHSIYTPRREAFYWATVMATFALGTAAGDMTATTMHLGYFSSGILFAALITFVAMAHFIVQGFFAAAHQHQSRNAVLSFWLAYILTRPLGASFADWAGKSNALGGLGWGDGVVALCLTIAIIAFVSYLTVTQRDVERTYTGS